MERVPDLVEEYIGWQLAQSPTAATYHGADGYDDLLPDVSASGFESRHADEDRFAARFAAVPDDGLTADERIDRDLVLSSLRGSAITRDWLSWRRNPDIYLGPGLMGVFSLFLRRFHDDATLVRSASARLREVPRVLDDGRANLDPSLASPLLVRRALGQCRAAVAYSRALLPTEVSDDGLRSQLADAGEVAATAYESFAAFLEDLAERCTGDWALGEDRYSALLRDKEMLADDAGSLRERGRDAWERLDAELRALCEAAWHDDDWRGRLDVINRDRPTTAEEMRAGYEHATAEARRFLADNSLVTLPDGESCAVVPSPPFQRPVLAVASYLQPPALREGLAGRFNVPYPTDGTTDEELAERMADNSYPTMPTISVHEVYPGHHWHFAWLQVQASPIRRLVTTPYFVEGWALYAELVMRENGFFTDPAHELSHLDARIFRAARIVADTSLHCGDMTFDEAVTYMHEHTGLTEATARVEVTRYCAWPTQAASYLTGSLEIERLRRRWDDERRGDVRAFHDQLAGSGALPLALAERAVFG